MEILGCSIPQHPSSRSLRSPNVPGESSIRESMRGDQTAYNISYFALSWMLVKLMCLCWQSFFYVDKDSFVAEPTSLQFHMYMYRAICKCTCTHMHISVQLRSYSKQFLLVSFRNHCQPILSVAP